MRGLRNELESHDPAMGFRIPFYPANFSRARGAGMKIWKGEVYLDGLAFPERCGGVEAETSLTDVDCCCGAAGRFWNQVPGRRALVGDGAHVGEPGSPLLP